MAEVRQFRQNTQIIHGTTAQNNAKLTDIMPLQHEDLATQTNQMKKISLGQCLCEPFAVCNSNNPANGAYVADCVNFPDFTLQFTDGQGNNHSLIGLKVRVLFNYGITYGSVSGGTYPTLNINGSGAIPLLAQGKTMGAGAISAGQTVEFTIIPYGNSLAFDADSNVREANSDYTVYTDGSITYTKSHIDKHNCYIFYVDKNTERGNKFCGVIAQNTTIERAFTDFARNGNFYYFIQIQAFNETTGVINTCERLTITNITYPLGNNAEIQVDRTNNVVRFVNNTAYPLQLSFEVIYSR